MLALAFIGCHERLPSSIQQRGSGPWQVVWVDPQIVTSDPTFTLFRSDRIDSVRVKPGVDYFPQAPASLTFHVETRRCEVALRLYDSKRKLVKLLLNQALTSGHYKVAFGGAGLPVGAYTLQAEVCGKRTYRQVTVSH